MRTTRQRPAIGPGSPALALTALLLAALAAGCKPPQTMDEPAFIQFVSAGGQRVDFDVNLGKEPKDLYFVYTNSSTSYAALPSMAAASLTGDAEGGSRALSDAPPSQAAGPLFPIQRTGPVHRPVDREATERLLSGLRVKPRASQSAASRAPHSNDDLANVSTDSFFDVVASERLETEVYFDATCRYASDYLDMGGGVQRKLSIWVADDCWHSSASAKAFKVSPEMVEALAARFIGSAANRSASIYSLVTNILGPEWGPTSYSNLIEGDDSVTIVLHDIDDDGDTGESGLWGGTVGYFYSGNNATKADFPYSNERVMFFIDAVMFANDDEDGSSPYASATGWNDGDYWPKEIYSTLAHEFQHMIHFYQKDILRGAQDPAWTDEMCSMVMEDLLADRLGVPGPRGVAPTEYGAGSPGNAEGRIPLYNYFNYYGIGDDDYWYGSNYDALLCYSGAYALGAYLARNYGGAEFVRRVVQSESAGAQAVEEAVADYSGGADFDALLRRFTVAVLLSDKTDAPAPYRFNTGGSFDSSIGSTTYRLGSINFWNYSFNDGVSVVSGPLADALTADRREYWYDAYNINGMMSVSNVYVQAASGATGKRSWSITLPRNTALTVVAR